MASKSNDRQESLARANKEMREALKDCDALLEQTRVMLERSQQDNQPRRNSD